MAMMARRTPIAPQPRPKTERSRMGVAMLPETHPADQRIPLRVGALVRSLASVARSGRFHRVAWAAALMFGGQFIYISSASIVVVDLLGLGELDFWVLFAPLVGGVMIGSQVSSWAAGRIAGNRLVTGALLFCVTAAGVNVAVATTVGPVLPWVVLGPALLGLGTVAAYPTMQLILLDLFPAGRGSAVSLFTFFTLLLNGTVAGADFAASGLDCVLRVGDEDAVGAFLDLAQ